MARYTLRTYCDDDGAKVTEYGAADRVALLSTPA